MVAAVSHVEHAHAVQVSWDDIAGQDTAKRLVQELVVWPMLNPHLFKASAPPINGSLPSSAICPHAWPYVPNTLITHVSVL